MRGLLSALYSALVYVFFFATFLYLIGFVEGIVVPKTLYTGEAGPLAPAIAINLGLMALFAAQHSVMARPCFKAVWTRVVPKSVERATFVLAASLVLILLFWQWRPMPQVLWSIDNSALAGVVLAISFGGWGLVLLSTFLISHFHLFGLTQGWARVLKLSEPAPHFVTPLFYKWIRHPLYTGFVIAFWAAPEMTLGRLLFAVGLTGHILLGIFLEERDLVAEFGARYLRYRETAGMLFPRLFGPKREREAARTI